MGHGPWKDIWMVIEDQTPLPSLHRAFWRIWPHLPCLHDFSLLCIDWSSSSFVFYLLIYCFLYSPASLRSNSSTSSMKPLYTCNRALQLLPSLCHLCSQLQCLSSALPFFLYQTFSSLRVGTMSLINVSFLYSFNDIYLSPIVCRDCARSYRYNGD